MKNDVMSSVVQMEAGDLQQLTTVVKETVDSNFELPKEKRNNRTFGIVDLWNIRRNTRYAGSMKGR
ncbi:MAG: hypothetical protein JJE22_05315 [Bacteroidia bacterium]|nr:hypothetical protein [Bacteroidia bacterium]